ncbi:tetratricopeptide repeat protein [Shewanella sp. AS16]|uniref:tetratricopeptide repeat protein n=1 Tax=Shewanella sp. AS16 TaxID=2907625 RepID=UPI001F2A157F|nr:tetratricopeptide repeat protein [Shewanella sp. AS16]MCE9685371.1 tetratricopeptide repeat protein [Shewanella sp. AS16]
MINKIKSQALMRFLLLCGVLSIAGCASTQSEVGAVKPPQRQDLFGGQSVPTASPDAPPMTEQEALDRAVAEERAGHLDKALYSYIQALDFNESNADTLYHIANVQSVRGNDPIAYRAYQEALVLNPEHMLAHAELGVIEMEQRQYHQARLHLEKAVGLDQHRLEALQNSTQLQSHFPLDQDSPLRVYNALAILDDLENKHEVARDYFRLVLDFQPQSAMIATNLGYSYYLTGEFITAEHYLKRAISEDPGFKRARTNLGLIYIRKGWYAKALSTLEQTMSPADALNDLGYFLMLEGQYDKAIELFQKAIDSSPSYFERAQKNLKNALAEQRQEIEQAKN